MAVVTGVNRYRGIVVLSLDGLETAHIRERDFALFPLEEGDAVDEAEYMDRLAAKQMADAFDAALTILEAGEKTQADLKRALLRKGFVSPAVEAAVARAAEYRFVDDKRYANRNAQVGVRKDMGIYALKRKLRAKGISEEDAQEALAALDEDQQREACARQFAKIAYKYEGLPAREARAKASQALARRGFSWDAISAVLEDALDDWD